MFHNPSEYSVLQAHRDGLKQKIFQLRNSPGQKTPNMTLHQLLLDLKRQRESKQAQLSKLIGSIRFETKQVDKCKSVLSGLNMAKKQIAEDRVQLMEKKKQRKKNMDIECHNRLQFAKFIQEIIRRKNQLIMVLNDTKMRLERHTNILEVHQNRAKMLECEIINLEKTNNIIEDKIKQCYAEQQKNVNFYRKLRFEIQNIKAIQEKLSNTHTNSTIDLQQLKCNIINQQSKRINSLKQSEIVSKQIIGIQLENQKQLAEFKKLSTTNKQEQRRNESTVSQLSKIQAHLANLRNINSGLKSSLGEYHRRHANYSKAYGDLMRTTTEQWRWSGKKQSIFQFSQ